MDAWRDDRLLVHCALNMRVSAFVFLWRVLRLGETVEVASQDLRRIWQPNDTWRNFIARMLQQKRAS